MLFWKLSLASPLTFFQVKYCLAYQFLISCKIKTAIKTTNIHILKSENQNQNLKHEHIFVVFFYDSSYTRRQKSFLNSWTGIGTGIAARVFSSRWVSAELGDILPLEYILEKNSGPAGILEPGTQSGARPGAQNFQNLSPDGARILLPG